MATGKETRAIPIGIDDFKMVREGNYYFVDKSELIPDILAGKAEVYLYTRPRRFGKSLNLSMLDAFFNLRYKGNNWFEGLKVSGNPAAEAEMNASPVICLDMADVLVESYDEFLGAIRQVVYLAYLQFSDLRGMDVPMELCRDYLDVSVLDFDESKLIDSVNMLCMMVELAYGIKPIVLVDEYDGPLNRAYGKDVYGDVAAFLHDFYSAALKSNSHLRFAVVTGVMQIAKETIFSGLNNLKVNNIFACMSDERYGFTASEVREMCAYYGHEESFDLAREWYGGYRFGNAEIYNPWSIINYVSHGFKPAPYWAGTSGNDIIDSLLAQVDFDDYPDLQALAEGKSIRRSLPFTIPLSNLDGGRDAVFSVMTVAGYLNAVPFADDMYDLSIPNNEMRRVFSSMMLKRIHTDASRAFRSFFNGMVEKDAVKMNEGLDLILSRNVPFILLADEKDYQLIIASAAIGMLGTYNVKLESEAGNGRADIIMTPNRPGAPNVVLELKRTKSSNPAVREKSAHLALEQIKEKKYFKGLKGRVLLYGICFSGKESSIAIEELHR